MSFVEYSEKRWCTSSRGRAEEGVEVDCEKATTIQQEEKGGEGWADRVGRTLPFEAIHLRENASRRLLCPKRVNCKST